MQFINTESLRALDKREKHIKSSFLRLIISKHQKIAISCENEVYQIFKILCVNFNLDPETT